jgi:hypothetical protein
VVYCQWIGYSGVTLFTDEVSFNLSGYVNRQNSRGSSATNRHDIKDLPLHGQKVGVWCAMSRNRTIGPIFLDDTTNSERYYEAVLNPFIAYLNEDEIARGYFQQARATAHTDRVSMTIRSGLFGDKHFK